MTAASITVSSAPAVRYVLLVLAIPFAVAGDDNSSPAGRGTSADGTVTITWSAVEGGTYSVDASPTQAAWTSKATGIVATDISKSASYQAIGSSGTEYASVNRTALAAYDANGQTAATVTQSAITSYVATASAAPTINSITAIPVAPTSSDRVYVTASIAPSAGRSISQAQLTYNVGSGTSKVFNETMGTAAAAAWTGAGTVYPWTIAFTGPPNSPFNQTTAANHTTTGQGNPFDPSNKAARLAGQVLDTPCVESRTLSEITGAQVRACRTVGDLLDLLSPLS